MHLVSWFMDTPVRIGSSRESDTAKPKKRHFILYTHN